MFTTLKTYEAGSLRYSKSHAYYVSRVIKLDRGKGQSLAYNFDGLSGPASKGSATDSPVFHLLSLTRSGLKRSVNLLQEIVSAWFVSSSSKRLTGPGATALTLIPLGAN